MKTICFLQVLLWSFTAWAQPYAVDWFTTDAGAGVSSGGNYSLVGTTGQPDAGIGLTGGAYQVVGGFWYAGTTGTSTAVTLNIGFISDVAVLFSWPGDQAGFSLQQAASLAVPVTWTDVPGAATLMDGLYKFPFNMDSNARFFRLIRH